MSDVYGGDYYAGDEPTEPPEWWYRDHYADPYDEEDEEDEEPEEEEEVSEE